MKNRNILRAKYLLDGFIQKSTKKNPIFVTFFVTSKCNSNCKPCFYWKELSNKKNELALNEIDKIAKGMHGFHTLLISGGEPFLRKDLADICKIFYDNNKIRHINIPTNASLPKTIKITTERILKSCSKSLITLQISIDGIGKEHDELRGLKNNFKKMLETYNYLLKLRGSYNNLEITFCNTVSSYNKNNIKKIYKFLLDELNCNKIFSVLTRGDARCHKSKNVSLKKYRELIELAKLAYNQNCIKHKSWINSAHLIRHILLYMIIHNIKKTKKLVIPCYAAVLNCVIDEIGNVYSCEIKKHKLGNLRENNYNFNQIWNCAIAINIRKVIKRTECFCTDETFVSNNLRFSLRAYPFLIKELIKLLLQKNA